jgi:hypothetical protein
MQNLHKSAPSSDPIICSFAQLEELDEWTGLIESWYNQNAPLLLEEYRAAGSKGNIADLAWRKIPTTSFWTEFLPEFNLDTEDAETEEEFKAEISKRAAQTLAGQLSAAGQAGDEGEEIDRDSDEYWLNNTQTYQSISDAGVWDELIEFWYDNNRNRLSEDCRKQAMDPVQEAWDSMDYCMCIDMEGSLGGRYSLDRQDPETEKAFKQAISRCIQSDPEFPHSLPIPLVFS